MRIRDCVLVIVLIAACSKETPGTGSSGTGSSGPSVAPAIDATAPAPAGSVEIFVDDASVARVTKEQLASWPRLDALVPENARRLGTWQTVYIRGAGKPAELNKPSATYPEQVGALFPGD
jgi:hypothetical protein